MPTRFNSSSKPRYGVIGINAPTHQGTPDLTIPAVGIEDVDIALFKLFDNEIKLQVGGNNSDFKKVPVIFATGEKWAILKKKRALRDKNDSLILPLITIARTSVNQDFSADIVGRGINQQTGEIVIKRRLDKSDRAYQNLINRYLLKNQLNVATNQNLEHVDEQLLTDREIGSDSNNPIFRDGAWLADIKKNNIYETIVIPSPQFCSLGYEITIWTQYTQHMNQLLEQVISSFLPQGNAWKLDTQKGYWFIATVEGNSYSPDNNFDDLGQEERIIKYTFDVKVNAYIFASQYPGVGIPVKRYVSCPIIKFNTDVDTVVLENDQIVEGPFLGSDDPTLPLNETKNSRLDQRNVGTKLLNKFDSLNSSDDPAIKTRSTQNSAPLFEKVQYPNAEGKLSNGYVRVYKINQSSGESIIKPVNLVTDKPAPDNADTILGGLSYHIIQDK